MVKYEQSRTVKTMNFIASFMTHIHNRFILVHDFFICIFFFKMKVFIRFKKAVNQSNHTHSKERSQVLNSVPSGLEEAILKWTRQGGPCLPSYWWELVPFPSLGCCAGFSNIAAELAAYWLLLVWPLFVPWGREQFLWGSYLQLTSTALSKF